MNGLQALALLTVALFSTVMLKECGWRGSALVGAVGVVSCLALALSGLGTAVKELLSFGEDFGVGETVKLALKALGIGYVFGIAADLCRQLGEAGLGQAAETLGRVELIILSLPVVRELIDISVGFLNGQSV